MRDCHHGHLARSCEICDLEREVADLRRKVEHKDADGHLFHRIELRTNEYHLTGKVDQVVLIGHDMQLKTDIRSVRDIRLAERMADELGVEMVDIRDR